MPNVRWQSPRERSHYAPVHPERYFENIGSTLPTMSDTPPCHTKWCRSATWQRCPRPQIKPGPQRRRISRREPTPDGTAKSHLRALQVEYSFCLIGAENLFTPCLLRKSIPDVGRALSPNAPRFYPA